MLLCFFLTATGYGQVQKNMSKLGEDDANEHFQHKNYLMAIPIYRKELKKDPDNDKMRFKLAQCLLYTRVNRQEAVMHLEKLVNKNDKYDEAWKELGRAYHLTNQLKKAEEAYAKFLELKPKSEKEIAHSLEQIKNARTLMNHPVNVTFQNLGAEINSDEPDYYPFVNNTETFLGFTSRRKDNIGGKKVEMDGYRSSDVYFCKIENGNGKWTKPANAGKLINTGFDEQIVGLRKDASELVIYLDHVDKYGDLYTTLLKPETKPTPGGPDFPYQKMKPVDPIINEKIETSGSFSEDGSVFIFTRRDKFQEGNNDLFMVRKLPNGKWGPAQKLPPSINTEFNEDFPFLSEDCQTLYFASEGHNSMGGYDLFKTVWNPEDNTFSKPENLGYPINSTDDDRSICVTPDNRVGYISAFRPGGFGDLDIYRIKFNESEQIIRILIGQLWLGDTVQEHQPKEIISSIIATNKTTNQEFTFVPHHKTGRFVMSLPAGKYSILVNSNGYKDLKEELEISDYGRIEIEKEKDYILTKK
jgi:hypothetical protein